MSEREQELSPVELEMMKVVWKEGRVTARQLCEQLAQLSIDAGRAPHKFSTVSTYLERLRLKGMVDREPLEARQYAYFALVSKEEIQKKMLQRLDGLFDSGGDFLHQFANTAKLGKREKQELKRIARQFGDKSKS